MLAAHGSTHDGFDTFANETIQADDALKSLDWEDMRIERFPLTPEVLYYELVKSAEMLEMALFLLLNNYWKSVNGWRLTIKDMDSNHQKILGQLMSKYQ